MTDKPRHAATRAAKSGRRRNLVLWVVGPALVLAVASVCLAAGIPAVSTRVGAEGLADQDGDWCALADGPADFAEIRPAIAS